MQEELATSIKSTIAKLELKQLDFMDKISHKHTDYVIRCVTCPVTNKILAVNGDWEVVTRFNEGQSIGKVWGDFVPKSDGMMNEVLNSKCENGTYACDLLSMDGKYIPVKWKSTYNVDIDAIVSVGRTVNQ